MSPSKLLAPRRKSSGVSHSTPSSSFTSISQVIASLAVRMPPAGLNPTFRGIKKTKKKKCNTHFHSSASLEEQSVFVHLRSQSAWDVTAPPGKGLTANRTRSGLALGAIKPQPSLPKITFATWGNNTFDSCALSQELGWRPYRSTLPTAQGI